MVDFFLYFTPHPLHKYLVREKGEGGSRKVRKGSREKAWGETWGLFFSEKKFQRRKKRTRLKKE
jgi:hypothetical protein